MVQILVKECQANVEFKTLFPIMKKHLADGDDVPYFFRELMAMITTVNEDEWGTGKDPSVKLSDETIRSYTKSCLLYTSPSPRDIQRSRMPSSA